MDMEQYNYYKSKILKNIKEQKQKHKKAYNLLKSIEEITNYSDDIPLALIYSTISHNQREFARVANEINDILQALMPKKEHKESSNESKDESKNKEPKKTEKSSKDEEKDYNKLDDEDDFNLDTDEDLE
jgi:hypothetical protein